MIDNDSKQEILREISAIRALLTRLQPVSGGEGGLRQSGNSNMMQDTSGKRVMVLF